MAQKHLVVQGAICQCIFGTTPDQLKVLTNKKEYANDSKGVKKLIASTMDIGIPFELGTFGACSKLLGAPCKSSVIQWQGFYPDVTLSNKGKILVEESTATCPIGGPGCIRILMHGQIAQVSTPNFARVNPKVHSVLNPMVDLEDVIAEYPAAGAVN